MLCLDVKCYELQIAPSPLKFAGRVCEKTEQIFVVHGRDSHPPVERVVVVHEAHDVQGDALEGGVALRIEGFFGSLARRRLRRRVYDSLEGLMNSILDFIALHNEKEAKPFKWTASPERVIAAHQRG